MSDQTASILFSMVAIICKLNFKRILDGFVLVENTIRVGVSQDHHLDHLSTLFKRAQIGLEDQLLRKYRLTNIGIEPVGIRPVADVVEVEVVEVVEVKVVLGFNGAIVPDVGIVSLRSQIGADVVAHMSVICQMCQHVILTIDVLKNRRLILKPLIKLN